MPFGKWAILPMNTAKSIKTHFQDLRCYLLAANTTGKAQRVERDSERAIYPILLMQNWAKQWSNKKKISLLQNLNKLAFLLS